MIINQKSDLIGILNWKINGNKLFFRIMLDDSVKQLFFGYIHHRFRKFYSLNHIFHLPRKWAYRNNHLILEYDYKLINNIKVRKYTVSNNNLKKCSEWINNELMHALLALIKNHENKIYGIFQCGLHSGKIIPPPVFFLGLGIVKNIDYIELKKKDLRFLLDYISEISNKYFAKKEKKDENFLKNIRDALNEEKYDQIRNLIYEYEYFIPFSFLNFFAEAEFFYKIREIYKFRKISSKKLINDGITLKKNEIALEISKFKDPHFGVLNKPTPQELWDSLIESQKISREILLTHNVPNPFSKKTENFKKGEWIRTHEDQPIIFIRSNLSFDKIPRRGYLFVYEYGDIDLIQKKKYFLKTIIRSNLIQNLLRSKIKENGYFKNSFPKNELVSRILNNHGIFTVQGPPGTGKTHLATEVVYELLKRNKYVKILITAKEHLALNHILKRITTKLKEKKIDFRAFRSISAQKLKWSNYDKDISKYIKNNILSEISSFKWRNDQTFWKKFQNEILYSADLRNESIAENSANLFFCTTMDNAFYTFFFENSFDLVIVEEAGKCYPTELLHILPLGQNVLLIGDQKQLPPYQIKETKEAISKWEEVLERAKYDQEFKKKLKERFGRDIEGLLNYFLKNGKIENDKFLWLKPFECIFNILPPYKKYLLREQYRMEKPLSDIIGRVFYKKEFIHKKSPRNPIEGVIPKKYDVPLLWINTQHCLNNPETKEDPEGTGERINAYEARVIFKYLQILNPLKNIDLVILTPYKDQKNYLLNFNELFELYKNSFLKKFKDSKKFDEIIKTVDEFQGQEADITIISLVRNNIYSGMSSWGFLTEPERLNVMFSRASYRQVIIGCAEQILRNKENEDLSYLVKFFEEYKKEGKIIEAERFLNDE
ncbi:MAG: DEAD/DEAH box helicase [Candidatus Helarchaeota archaeon]